MKKLFYLFIFLFFIPFISAAPNYDSNIYVSPFVFGVINGVDGQPLNLLNNNFNEPESRFQTIINYPNFTDLDSLSIRIVNNTLFIAKPSSSAFKSIPRINNYNKFFIRFNHPEEYPDSNINILFRLNN